MDRVIAKSWHNKPVLRWGGLAAALIVVIIVLFLTADTSNRLKVSGSHLTTTTVERGPFQEYIPLSGTVMPIRTVYLDAIEGGRVERVIRDAGSMVDVGDTILQLSNTSLLLDIMNREAQLFEQRNNLRNTRLAMQQNALQLKAQLLDIDRRIRSTQRKYERDQKLSEKGLISNDDFEESRDEHEYYVERKSLTLENQRQDSLFRTLQIEMLEASVERIETNLEFVRQNLENLFLKAPVRGQVTSLNAEIGESKRRGERLGQIDVLDGFKVRASVDEFYVTRLERGLKGNFDLSGNRFDMQITKIYPEIREGRFEIDLEFEGTAPDAIRRGQSVHLRLKLSDPTERTIIRRGPYFQKTGGRWVFVLDPSGEEAHKREIKVGRQNPDVLEILEGLEPGEKVIISSYDTFGDVDKLVLTD